MCYMYSHRPEFPSCQDYSMNVRIYCCVHIRTCICRSWKLLTWHAGHRMRVACSVAVHSIHGFARELSVTEIRVQQPDSGLRECVYTHIMLLITWYLSEHGTKFSTAVCTLSCVSWSVHAWPLVHIWTNTKINIYQY